MQIAWLGPLPLSNEAVGRAGHDVKFIVMHHMAGTLPGADARFHNPSSNVSAHFGVSRSGDVVQWVKEADTAYHAGNLTANYESIGIEHEDLAADDYTDAEYAASAQLVQLLCLKLGVPIQSGDFAAGVSGVVRHRDIVPTACPGTLDVGRIIREAQTMTPEQEAKLDRVLALLEANGPLVWVARTQRSLDVETGKPFDEKVPPTDPRIRA